VENKVWKDAAEWGKPETELALLLEACAHLCGAPEDFASKKERRTNRQKMIAAVLKSAQSAVGMISEVSL
jgi:hypothetical protein